VRRAQWVSRGRQVLQGLLDLLDNQAHPEREVFREDWDRTDLWDLQDLQGLAEKMGRLVKQDPLVLQVLTVNGDHEDLQDLVDPLEFLVPMAQRALWDLLDPGEKQDLKENKVSLALLGQVDRPVCVVRLASLVSGDQLVLLDP